MTYEASTLAVSALLFAEAFERELLANGVSDGQTYTLQVAENRLDMLSYQLADLAERAHSVQQQVLKPCGGTDTFSECIAAYTSAANHMEHTLAASEPVRVAAAVPKCDVDRVRLQAQKTCRWLKHFLEMLDRRDEGAGQ